ncbi:MAG: peptidoglycan-binding protein [Oricola sp.]
MTILSATRGLLGWIGETIAENPGSAGAVTAFGVAMAFFTANAVYFQDGRHPAALFATRPETVRFVPEERAVEAPAVRQNEPNVTRFVIRETDNQAVKHPEIPMSAPLPARRPSVIAVDQASEPSELPRDGDAGVAGIQELLAKLGYYGGEVDGLRGPKTNAAIDAYKNNVGLRGIELTDAELMTSIRNNLDVTAAIPAPRPQSDRGGELAPTAKPAPVDPAPEAAKDEETLLLPDRIPSAEVVKVQAALRAFGNTDVAVDGIAGEQTQAAIREFQSLFRLPVTGEIDGVLLDKMRAVGLIQ